MKKILSKSSFSYFIRHPWQIGLSILGIAIGVAIGVATGNLAIWIAIGVAIGAALGAGWSRNTE